MNFIQFFLVFAIGVFASFFNIIPLIIGYIRTPPGYVYLATGHYYLDYFEYLQALSQGLHGHWIWENYYDTDIKMKSFLGMWQHLIFGQIGRLLGLSPAISYWISMFVLSIVLSLLIFFFIKKLLENKPFYWQLSAYILTIFAAPFFRIVKKEGWFFPFAYRFWNDRAVLVDRLDGMLYHVTDQIITLVIILLIAGVLDKIASLSKKSLILKTTSIIGLLSFILSFSPSYFVLLAGALSLTLVVFIILKKPGIQIKYLFFLLSVIFPIGLIYKYSLANKLYGGISQIETVWQVHPPLYFVLLTLGPIVVFSLFGIKKYFLKATNLKLVFFNFVFVSYVIFCSPLGLYLGTTNTRFLTPLNYILLGALTVLAFKKTRSLFLASLVILILFIPSNIESVVAKTTNRNLITPISYLPKGIIDGWKFLHKQPDKKVVLTTPALFLGMIAPIYTDKPVYLSRPGQYKYEEKVNITSRFYWKTITDLQAEKFLEDNQIGYITLTSMEDYPLEKVKQYKFLKKIYQNKDIIIFKKI